MSINEFRGAYRFLSNFWPGGIPVFLDGDEYTTVEHAFQASKTLHMRERRAFQKVLRPGEAKKMGRALKDRGLQRPDWENVKRRIMKDLLGQKFSEPELRDKLLDTGDQEIIEGNTWGDTYWGVCNGQGQNWLGKLLMEVRSELLAKTPTKRVLSPAADNG